MIALTAIDIVLIDNERISDSLWAKNVSLIDDKLIIKVRVMWEF